jgi:hypothetical protein
VTHESASTLSKGKMIRDTSVELTNFGYQNSRSGFCLTHDSGFEESIAVRKFLNSLQFGLKFQTIVLPNEAAYRHPSVGPSVGPSTSVAKRNGQFSLVEKVAALIRIKRDVSCFNGEFARE